MLTNMSTIDLCKKIFSLSTSSIFENNTNVNSQHLDTFENHSVDFSISSNVTLDTKDYSICLNDTTKEGYYVTKPIASLGEVNSKINMFYLLSSFSVETELTENEKPTVRFYIVTPGNEEFEISHNAYIPLKLLNSIPSFKIKCVLTPNSKNETPKVYGYNVHFKDYSVLDLNITNV